MSKIRIRHGDDEIELEGSDQFISRQLANFYERVGQVGRATANLKRQLLEEPPPSKPGKPPTPAEFYRSKGKTDGLSRLLIFARYLEEYEGSAEFTAADVNRVAKEARLAKDIHPQYFTNAVKQGLLRKSGGKYSLTLSAEEVLASM